MFQPAIISGFLKRVCISLVVTSIVFGSVFISLASSALAETGGSISGKVTDATDAALPSVMVNLYNSSGYSITSTSTDATGNYTFSGLSSGNYFVEFYKLGMQTVWYSGATTLQTATSISVTSPNATTGINGKLGIGGSISGKVTDATDAALPSVMVTLYNSSGYSIASTSTDATGNYTFSGLSSGNYFVEFYKLGMQTVWYSGATTLQTATLISVTSPNATIGINERLRSTQLATLSCTVGGLGGGAVTIPTPQGNRICATGTCTADVETNSTIRVIAIPDSISSFGGWSGDCNNSSGDCELTMNMNKSITAAFNFAPKIKISRTGAGYTTVQDAHTNAQPGDILQFIEDTLAINSWAISKQLILKGGYNSVFGVQEGDTILQGILVIGSGPVVVDRIVLK